jgi:hypothetical protein
MATIVRKTIYDWEIGRLFLPGPGETAWNWMERAGREQMWHTLRLVPRRTGALAASHNLALTPAGPLNVRYSIGTYSEYADYVIHGTTGPIWGDGGWTDEDGNHWLLIRPFPHSWFAYPVGLSQVDGQDANNYLLAAAMEMIRKYA